MACVSQVIAWIFKFKIRTNLMPLYKASITLPLSLLPNTGLGPDTCLAARLNHWAGRTRSREPPPILLCRSDLLAWLRAPSPAQIHRGCAHPSPRCTTCPGPSMHQVTVSVTPRTAAPHPGQVASKSGEQNTSCCNSSGHSEMDMSFPIKGKYKRVKHNILLTSLAEKSC